ncbi:hypothetical protein [Achromobacter xylosoxidans]|uniref:hypothetical protein n=1 Tax=Alcaligenes xylosoxydans xylosoxydans TaxID=85698 RepID=UPI002A75DD1A|nr:hypothetical protein [Achromobacter xylosoxidans]WPQ33669.1 hypothetical protein SLH34_24030 [Achromobacter xylosoxidans]
MKQSDLNHLRRLLGWVRCDIGQDPAGQQLTMIDIAGKLPIDSIDADAKARLVEGYRRAEAVPVYVRDAVKALEKALAAVGRDPGVVAPRATAETRANAGFTLGVEAGRETMLTDEQIRTLILEKIGNVTQALREDAMEFARAIETAVRSKPRAPVAVEAMPRRQALLEAIHCYGNARAMAEHNIAYRDEIRRAVDALIALLDAAPQANALDTEYTCGRADGFDAGYSAALEKAAALVGGHTWAGASQIVSDLIAEHIRALKTQADKDRGQQRAGDAALARLAEPHTGMRVDYQGLLRQAREGLHDSPGLAEMLRQLQGHLRELGQRWYAGDTAVVDELLQLYCVESNARAALSGTQSGQGERQ